MPPMAKTSQYWLMKSEPGAYSIDDLKKDKKTYWNSVRNYQARNFMRDQMQVGDLVLFYHSNADPAGVAGIARVCKKGYPDFTAQDVRDKYYDLKATTDNPIWFMVDVQFVKNFKNLIPLEALKNNPKLSDMMVVKRGMRLSIQPVTEKQFNIVIEMGE